MTKIEAWSINGNFGPAVVSIPWEEGSVFPSYLHWLNNRKVEDGKSWAYMIGCYCWGSHIQDEVYQDMIISSIIERLRRANEAERRKFLETFNPKFTSKVYKLTSDRESPIRKLIVYAIGCVATEKDLAKPLGEMTGWPNDFTVKMAAIAGKALKEKTGGTKGIASGDKRAVRFVDATEHVPLAFAKDSADESECTYHHHTKRGLICWRRLEEFNK